MAASLAGRVKQGARSWWHTDPMEVSADPADVESVTIRYLIYVLLPAWFDSTAAAGVHGATAIWDVRAAVGGGRDVHPAEQQIHRFLESLPFMAMSPLLCLHWG